MQLGRLSLKATTRWEVVPISSTSPMKTKKMTHFFFFFFWPEFLKHFLNLIWCWFPIILQLLKLNSSCTDLIEHLYHLLSSGDDLSLNKDGVPPLQYSRNHRLLLHQRVSDSHIHRARSFVFFFFYANEREIQLLQVNPAKCIKSRGSNPNPLDSTLNYRYGLCHPTPKAGASAALSQRTLVPVSPQTRVIRAVPPRISCQTCYDSVRSETDAIKVEAVWFVLFILCLTAEKGINASDKRVILD